MIHPAHDGHQIQCVTYDCTPHNHDDDQHAVRCTTCHCWADQDPRPGQARLAHVEALIAARQQAENDDPQPALFEVNA